MKRIGLITTLDTNIGDDFIRKGICHVLAEIFKGQQIEFISVNKHKPYTVYPAWHPIHLRDVAERFPVGHNFVRQSADYLFSKMGFSRFDDCDLIVRCGAPVFWPDCHQNEWAEPIWHDVVGRLHKRIPVLNLAAGSCYPWERQPDKIEDPGDAQYIGSILGYCRLTTVRDKLSHNICKSFGYDVPLIPCTAFLAGMGKAASLKAGSHVLINYMSGGGHYGWEQGIDPKEWEKTVRDLISRLKKRHNLVFLCHNELEYQLAKGIEPTLPRMFPKSVQDYFDCISEAKFGICNRMHASVGMAGIGVSSVAICTDTRLLMVSGLGLKTHYVKDATADILEEEVESAVKNLPGEQERLLALQQETWRKYQTVTNEVLLNSRLLNCSKF